MIRNLLARLLLWALGADEAAAVRVRAGMARLEGNESCLDAEMGRCVKAIASLRRSIRQSQTKLSEADLESVFIQISEMEIRERKRQSDLDNSLLFIDKFRQQQELYAVSSQESERLRETITAAYDRVREAERVRDVHRTEVLRLRENAEAALSELAEIKARDLHMPLEQVVRGVMDEWLADHFKITLRER